MLTNGQGAGVVVQRVKLPLGMPATYVGVPVQVPDAMPREVVKNGSSTWAPTIHMRDSYGDPGSWHKPGPALTVESV